MSEFQRYGQAELGGAYYLVREVVSAFGTRPLEGVSTFYIDGLGNIERVASAASGSWKPEDIARMPTITEARAHHLGPAFAEAEANQRKWAEEQEREGRDFDKPDDEPTLSPATARFLDDGDY